MDRKIKICCLAGLGVLLLFVAACDDEQASASKTRSSNPVVSKSIPDVHHPAATDPAVSDDAGPQHTPVSEMDPEPDSVDEAQAPGDINDASGVHTAGIFTPLAKYETRGRVDPFIPLVAEKSASSGQDASARLTPKRTLTPLEKLELSQVKLVAVVEMSRQTIAMVEDATGKGYEVTVGTYIGPDGGRVTAITRDGIEIAWTVKDYEGKSLKRYDEIKFHKSEEKR